MSSFTSAKTQEMINISDHIYYSLACLLGGRKGVDGIEILLEIICMRQWKITHRESSLYIHNPNIGGVNGQ